MNADPRHHIPSAQNYDANGWQAKYRPRYNKGLIVYDEDKPKYRILWKWKYWSFSMPPDALPVENNTLNRKVKGRPWTEKFGDWVGDFFLGIENFFWYTSVGEFVSTVLMFIIGYSLAAIIVFTLCFIIFAIIYFLNPEYIQSL